MQRLPRLRPADEAAAVVEGVVVEAELYRRLSEASKEIENYREYGYILVNDILDRAVAQLEAIVLAERFYRNGEAIAYRSRRVLEVAAACLQINSQDRLKPVLEAFGILGPHGDQRQLDFGDEGNEDDPSEDDPNDEDPLNDDTRGGQGHP